jgi:putative PIN family toxin of toxin-antitoxin system
LTDDGIYAIKTAVKRVVIDTNILVSACLGNMGSSHREVLRMCLKRQIQPIVGVALFCEYEDLFLRSALMDKSSLNKQERRDLLDSFLSVCDWIKIYYLWRPNLPDEADNHLVELAIAGGASCIITQNLKDLNQGQLHFPNLKILSPQQFLKSI